MLKPDKSWTLFLDRDGVINHKIDEDYVKSYEEFEFMPHFQESIKYLRQIFGHIIVVTNQQGIGKKLMTENDLMKIHWQMQFDLQRNSAAALIDKIYHCPELTAANSPNRKPQIGMALQAKKDFPKIDFNKSVMIGDSMTDMEFGKTAGMITILLTEKTQLSSQQSVDYTFRNWQEIVVFFKENK